MKDLEDWMKSTGVDALGMLGPESRGLGGFDMVAVAVGKDRWDISIAELRAALAPGKAGMAQLAGKGELPATYLFKTREGAIGVLQIVGFAENPKAVKIRYKLVRKPVPAAAVAFFDSSKVQAMKRLAEASEAQKHGDQGAMQRFRSELAAKAKEFEAMLKGTVAEMPLAELRNRQEAITEAYNKALRQNDRQAMERLRQEGEILSTTIDGLIHGTAAPAAEPAATPATATEPNADQAAAIAKIKKLGGR